MRQGILDEDANVNISENVYINVYYLKFLLKHSQAHVHTEKPVKMQTTNNGKFSWSRWKERHAITPANTETCLFSDPYSRSVFTGFTIYTFKFSSVVA